MMVLVDLDDVIAAIREAGITEYDEELVIQKVKAVTPRQQWIPCSRRIPEEEKHYLVTERGGGISDVAIDELAHYEDSGEPFWLYSPNKVTAWMPLLVDPYEEGET